MAHDDESLANLTGIAPGLAQDAPLREEILACHREAMAAGEQGYVDPASGFLVMTAASHLERGTCCENGCRHCPYGS